MPPKVEGSEAERSMRQFTKVATSAGLANQQSTPVEVEGEKIALFRGKKSFEVVLTVAARGAAKVACPICGGGEVTPQMMIFTTKTSRKR
jgi:hypothetical protein